MAVSSQCVSALSNALSSSFEVSPDRRQFAQSLRLSMAVVAVSSIVSVQAERNEGGADDARR